MSAKINVLIDKLDNFELIRNEIAAILLAEQAQQKALALAVLPTPKDANVYNFTLYIEKSTPWELIENAEGQIISNTPIVNVFFSSATNDSAKSNSQSTQTFKGQFIIDLYTAKTSEHSNSTNAIQRGDYLAAMDCNRLIRIIRNIIMNANYTYLNLQGVVTNRAISSINVYYPGAQERPSENVMAARITLSIDYFENTSENTFPTLDVLQTNCISSETGETYFNGDILQTGD